jgi:hypothetical protein
MRLRRLCFVALGLLLALGIAVVSCRSRDNEAYIDSLASLVVRYQERHGSPPDGFETAHAESGVTLPNRGDAYGRALLYHKFGDRGFLFRAYGTNGKNDFGLGDDLDIYYLDRRRVPREAFIRYLQSLDHEMPWQNAHRFLFEEESK